MFNNAIPHELALQHALKSALWAGLRFSSETTTQRAVRNDKPDRNESSLEEGVRCSLTGTLATLRRLI